MYKNQIIHVKTKVSSQVGIQIYTKFTIQVLNQVRKQTITKVEFEFINQVNRGNIQIINQSINFNIFQATSILAKS